MAKAVHVEGKVFRYRRGKLVEIPPKWVGNFTTNETIRQRTSKLIHKVARMTKWRRVNKGSSGGQYLKYKNDKDTPYVELV